MEAEHCTRGGACPSSPAGITHSVPNRGSQPLAAVAAAARGVTSGHHLGGNPVDGQSHFRKSIYFVERRGRLSRLGSVTAPRALSSRRARRTPRDRSPRILPTISTVLGDSRVLIKVSTPPSGRSLGGTGAIGFHPTPPLPAFVSVRPIKLSPIPVSCPSHLSEWLSAHPEWRIPTVQGTYGWD